MGERIVLHVADCLLYLRSCGAPRLRFGLGSRARKMDGRCKVTTRRVTTLCDCLFQCCLNERGTIATKNTKRRKKRKTNSKYVDASVPILVPFRVFCGHSVFRGVGMTLPRCKHLHNVGERGQ